MLKLQMDFWWAFLKNKIPKNSYDAFEVDECVLLIKIWDQWNRLEWSMAFKANFCPQPVSRDSGNDYRFPDFALHTGRFCLIFVRISPFWVDIRQLSLCLICHLFLFN